MKTSFFSSTLLLVLALSCATGLSAQDSYSSLPLEFTSIKGLAETNQNRINFTTTDNNESRLFFIERSADGKNYETIGQLAVESGPTEQYSFVDKKPLSTSFYRVRGSSILHRMVYSDVIRVNQQLSTLRVINQPGKTELIFSSEKAREVRLYAFTGQLVQQITIQNSRHTIQHNQLRKGMYVMQVNGEAIKIMVL